MAVQVELVADENNCQVNNTFRFTVRERGSSLSTNRNSRFSNTIVPLMRREGKQDGGKCTRNKRVEKGSIKVMMHEPKLQREYSTEVP